MHVRHLCIEDLDAILALYRSLHPDDPHLEATEPKVVEHWRSILSDSRLRYYGVELNARIVSSCTLTLIPNLTRGMRPYGLIENVVTLPAHRKTGCASAAIHTALEEAWCAGCYKVMLATGSKEESTLRFYERAGFLRGVKTGFIAYPPS